jgi:hypothetical protein
LGEKKIEGEERSSTPTNFPQVAHYSSMTDDHGVNSSFPLNFWHSAFLHARRRDTQSAESQNGMRRYARAQPMTRLHPLGRTADGSQAVEMVASGNDAFND